MSTAPNYTPETSFADDETNNVAGRSLVKTDSLDTELANISTSINALNTNQQAIQRDDGKLADSTVEPYALSEQTRALIAVAGANPRGTWAPNTDYAFKDVVQRNNIAQISLQSHNSGTTFTQSFWLPISGDGTSAANAAAAAASATAAASSATSASNSATSASTSATNASTSAGNAATSATNASNSANSAGTSATNAANSAAEAAQSVVDVNNVISASTQLASQAEAEAGTNNTKYMSALRTKQAIDFNLNRTGAAPMFACRAWVNFDGTLSGTIAPRGSGNVSSVTKNGTGDYTINFITNMPDVIYGVQATFGNGSLAGAYSMNAPFGPPTVSSVRIACANVATPPVLTDAGFINVQIIR